jgi:hypothetical protein
MTNHRAFCLLLFLAACGAAPQPDAPAPGSQPAGDVASSPETARVEPGANASAYWPLRAGARYEYRGTFQGQVFEKTLVVRQVDVGSEAAYYFIESDDEERGGDSLIGAGNNIGAGLYVNRADGVYTADVLALSGARRVTPKAMRRMLPTPLAVGAVTHLDGHWAHTYTVEGFESVKVPAGAFERVVRVGIKAGENGADTESSTAWIAPDIGVVRWQRATGRVDELVAFHPPPK